MLSTRVLLTNIYDYHVAFSVQKELLGIQLFPGKNTLLCAKTREVVCTKIVLPEAIEKGTTLYQQYGVLFIFVCSFSGLNIVEVAHDNQCVVKKHVTDDLNLTNSYDT